MGTFSIWHWLIVLAVALLLFGTGGKIPKLMRDLGQGINAFKRGLKESKEPEDSTKDPEQITADTATQAAAQTQPQSQPEADKVVKS